MSTFRVTLIDVDKNPCKLAENDLQFNDLRSQVSNYLHYMEGKTGLSRSAITCSMTLDRALIDELLNANQGAEGIRVYLVKESGDVNTQTDVSFLTLPVKRATDGPNKDLLVEMTSPETTAFEGTATLSITASETIIPEGTAESRAMAMPESLLAFMEECPTGACPPVDVMKANHTLLG